jgi:hypothetical protein
MKIEKATRGYEAWLARHTSVIQPDLMHKHQAMAENAFSFLRATFYRWAQHWPEVCATLSKAPHVLAVGDLHVENFGTWRDAEGRLAWGVNDFDEAYPLSYANDLVRLSTSVVLAIRAEHLAFDPHAACEAILDGYRRSIEAGGKPFIIEEGHRWFAPLIDQQARNPTHFWQKLRELPATEDEPPRGAIKGLRSLLPVKDIEVRICHRVAGLGSLGKPRYVALAEWHGGPIAREAKAVVPSGCAWAEERSKPDLYGARLLKCAIRCPDPLFCVGGRWVVRRLSPECSRVELTGLPKPHDDFKLLHAMGWETANLHLASREQIKKIKAHLKHKPASWLIKAANAMLEATLADWSGWRNAESHSSKS